VKSVATTGKAAAECVPPFCAEAASLSAHQHEDKAAVVSACDFQWCGGGLGVTDVMYLLWTSVQPQVVVDQEEELLR